MFGRLTKPLYDKESHKQQGGREGYLYPPPISTRWAQETSGKVRPAPTSFVVMETYMDLKDDEIICTNCHGSGRQEFTISHSKGSERFTINCQQCDGDGKFDWIENVLGKKNHGPLRIDNLTKNRHIVKEIQEIFGREKVEIIGLEIIHET